MLDRFGSCLWGRRYFNIVLFVVAVVVVVVCIFAFCF